MNRDQAPSRSASAFSCRKSALPAFFSYRRVACIHKDMNIARLQNGNPFRHDCSPPGRKSCIYIKQPNSSKSRISAICARSCFLSCNTLICAIKTWKNISASFIFAGGDPLVLFEGTDKIAQIIKAIPIGNLRDGIIGGSQLAAGLLDPLAVEVIHWCLMRHLGKEPAEIEIQISMSVLFYQKKHCDFQGIWI